MVLGAWPEVDGVCAGDTGLGRSGDDVDAWYREMQSDDGDGGGLPGRGARRLGCGGADAAGRGASGVWGGYEDKLARGDQADNLCISGDRGLCTAAGSAGVRFHRIGGNQTTQQT